MINLTTAECFYYVKNQTLCLLAQPEPVGAQKLIDSNVSPSSKHKVPPTVAANVDQLILSMASPGN